MHFAQCIAGPHVPQSPVVSLGHDYILVNNMWVEMFRPPGLVFKTISLSGPLCTPDHSDNPEATFLRAEFWLVMGPSDYAEFA